MIIFNFNDKDFKLVPRTRKVVELTERIKKKNLNEVIFNGLQEGDLKVLAEIIKSFSEYEDGKSVFTSLNIVYEFIDDWSNKNNESYVKLYEKVAEVVNEMGFFKKKMTSEELKKEIENPMSLDLNELMNNSAQKIIDEVAAEEFRGYKA